jgi:hypothetical protein
MKNKNRGILLAWLALTALTLLGPGCRLRDKAMGHVALREDQPMAALPNRAPERVYVADFGLDAQNFQGDQGVRGALPGRLSQLGQSGLGQNLPQPLATQDPAAEARRIVNSMADALVQDLTAQGLPAQRVDAAAGLPRNGWLVSGVFTEVDEGNRLKRAALGFGQGSTQMEVQVGLSDLAGKNPRAPFAVFGTIKEHGEMPGAAVTLNPYVAAAKFVMEKNATPRDVRNTADQIAAEILKFRDEVIGKPAR